MKMYDQVVFGPPFIAHGMVKNLDNQCLFRQLKQIHRKTSDCLFSTSATSRFVFPRTDQGRKDVASTCTQALILMHSKQKIDVEE
jgi:hypothetical protein